MNHPSHLSILHQIGLLQVFYLERESYAQSPIHLGLSQLYQVAFRGNKEFPTWYKDHPLELKTF